MPLAAALKHVDGRRRLLKTAADVSAAMLLYADGHSDEMTRYTPRRRAQSRVKAPVDVRA